MLYKILNLKEVGISMKIKKQVATHLKTASYHPLASIGYCQLDQM